MPRFSFNSHSDFFCLENTSTVELRLQQACVSGVTSPSAHQELLLARPRLCHGLGWGHPLPPVPSARPHAGAGTLIEAALAQTPRHF